MAGMRDYTDDELELVRKSFSGRYALRDRCYFEMALQMGLRVSEMLSLTVGQVYQYGKVVDEVSIERKHMNGGKAGKASGRTIPLFPETYPHILAWLVQLAGMLHVKDPKAIDLATPLFLSHVRIKDGSPRASARETAWRIIKAIARENELSGRVGTHITRKTLARKVYIWSNRYSCGATYPGSSVAGEYRGLIEITHRPRSLDCLRNGRGVTDTLTEAVMFTSDAMKGALNAPESSHSPRHHLCHPGQCCAALRRDAVHRDRPGRVFAI
jgi:hypothetical protein